MRYKRIKIKVAGAVQGVGFRPFVYRLATELQISGWILNSSRGVSIEAEAPPEVLERFLLRLQEEKPARAVVQTLEFWELEPVGYRGFEIRESDQEGSKTAFILPDLATCADCLREILDSDDRRFRYPFTNCTNCGPRFSIIRDLPYDRLRTSMREFALCGDCAREYSDPNDRRFHAEPTACPRCGPQLQFWNSLGEVVTEADAALLQAAGEIRAGKIVAVKGLGGFQLLVDARDPRAVMRLRERKCRAEKPFATLFPSLSAIRDACVVSELEERQLLSPEAPIVLLRQSGREQWQTTVSPHNPNLGVMLPYTPMHHLLMGELDFPVVATSGNLSDEPICIEEQEALERLCGIADSFLVHNRPIVRHVDDSIVRVLGGRELVLRRARGFAPLPITLKSPTSQTILALGAHLKNTVALRVEQNVFIGQHIGDLATQPAYNAFIRSARDLPRLYDATPQLIAHDLHPEYLSTQFALQQPGRHIAVQHHFAHIAACMAENEIEPPALGVAWDGTGFGVDGTIWGGEFLVVRQNGSFERVAHLRTFRLPGGEAAMREPRRCALGLLHEISIAPEKKVFEPRELGPLLRMLKKKINAPITSSAGRLFDAVASLIDLRQRTSFEGQAAMELESAVDPEVRASYAFALRDANPIIIDWEPGILELLSGRKAGVAPAAIAAKFHNMLVEMIVAVARKIGEPKVILSGGCFQNRVLTERAIDRLREEKFYPYWHQRIPPNDGGISLGQIAVASWRAP
jgi:hydrogenase maturation protein HypF